MAIVSKRKEKGDNLKQAGSPHNLIILDLRFFLSLLHDWSQSWTLESWKFLPMDTKGSDMHDTVIKHLSKLSVLEVPAMDTSHTSHKLSLWH